MAALVLSSVVCEAHNSLSADRISYFAYNEEKEELECIISKDIIGLCIPKTAGYVGKSFNSGIVINAKEIKEDHYKYVDEKVGYKTKNVLCAPLFDNNGNKLGVVQAVNKLNNDHFTEDDELRIQDICRILSKYLYSKDNDLVQDVINNITAHVLPTLEVRHRNLNNLDIIKWQMCKIIDCFSNLKNEEQCKIQNDNINRTNLILSNTNTLSSSDLLSLY
jgi:hypothetical protein